MAALFGLVVFLIGIAVTSWIGARRECRMHEIRGLEQRRMLREAHDRLGHLGESVEK